MSTVAALPDRIEGVQIIGIDCAAQPKDFGLARGRVRDGSLEIVEVTKLPRDANHLDRLSKQVGDWVGDTPDPPDRTLLALDAPLGWPIRMTRALHDHRAGAPLEHPSDEAGDEANQGNRLFRRHTDRFLAERFPGAPLDIGADRIARVARSALELLGRLETTANGPVPLLWDPRHLDRLGAIEVYPRLTLRHLRVHAGKAEIHYKASATRNPKHRDNRRSIVEENLLRPRLTLDPDYLRPKPEKDGPPDYDHDRIDAVLCVLEGLQFLRGKSVGPEHPEAVQWLGDRQEEASTPSLADIKKSEGWIWFGEADS